MIKNPKNARGNAERAAEWYAVEVMGCVGKPIRATKTQWQKQDLWSCDVLGKRADGALVALQVTASDFRQAVDSRKRKIAQETWHTSDTVQILQLVKWQPSDSFIGKQWYFKVYIYTTHGITPFEGESRPRSWDIYPVKLIPVPKHWFKKWKEGAE